MSAQELLQSVPISLVYKLVLSVMLSAFMVITAYSFLNTRVKKKQRTYARTIGFLGIGDDQAAFATRAVIDEYDRAQLRRAGRHGHLRDAVRHGVADVRAAAGRDRDGPPERPSDRTLP